MNFDIIVSEELCPEVTDILPYFKMRYSHTCENILVSNFMWKDYYNTLLYQGCAWPNLDHGCRWAARNDGTFMCTGGSETLF